MVISLILTLIYELYDFLLYVFALVKFLCVDTLFVLKLIKSWGLVPFCIWL